MSFRFQNVKDFVSVCCQFFLILLSTVWICTLACWIPNSQKSRRDKMQHYKELCCYKKFFLLAAKALESSFCERVVIQLSGENIHCNVIIGRNPIEADANTSEIQLLGNPVVYTGNCCTLYQEFLQRLYVQGLPSGFDLMYLPLADINMQLRFGLKVVLEF